MLTQPSTLRFHFLSLLEQEKEKIDQELAVERSRLQELQDLYTATKIQLAQFNEKRTHEMAAPQLNRPNDDAERILLLEQQISVYMEDWKSEKADKERALAKVKEVEQKVEQMQDMVGTDIRF